VFLSSRTFSPRELREQEIGNEVHPAADREEVWLASHWTLVLFYLFVISLCIRLAFLRIAPNNTTDAASRYHYALLWLHNPTQLPAATSSDAWLPLHFWLLGSILWLSQSELVARVFTAVLASLTVVVCAGIFSRAWNRRLAVASALTLALFGFHIAFSITTSVEAPTIFFLALGVYGWERYASQSGYRWLLISGAALGAASLCRFEAWLVAPVASLMLLDYEGGWPSLRSNRNAWRRALQFAAVGCSASIAWLVFSFLKWGDPLELPHRTMWLNSHFRPAILHHSVAFRVLTVPGALLISLSPLLLALACVGLIADITRGHWMRRRLALITLVLFAFNWWNSIRYETTQARYTLLYSWLLIPFAFQALCWISRRWPWSASRSALIATTGFFVLWQAGIVFGAKYGPPAVADRLGALSPTIPLRNELQKITEWLKSNAGSAADVTVLDDLDWDSVDIARFGKLAPDRTFEIRNQDYVNPSFLKSELEDFVRSRHPQLLVCSTYGPIGKMWNVDTRKHVEVEDLGISLDLEWQTEHWRVYKITYPPTHSSASATP
jgi:hypothetical protein